MGISDFLAFSATYGPLTDLISGVGTLVAGIATLITALLVYRQIVVARRAVQFQAYIGLENIVEGRNMREGIDAMNSDEFGEYVKECEKRVKPLSPKRQKEKYDDACREIYQKFLHDDRFKDRRSAIYDTFSFLNSVAHMVQEGHLGKYEVWSRYFFSYRVCYDRLYPWYIHGLRLTRYKGEEIAYATIEAMCVLVYEIDTWDARIKEKLLRHQRERLHIPVRMRLVKMIRRISEKTKMYSSKAGKFLCRS